MFTLKTKVDAPVNRVWECWTLPEHIIHWNHASEEWQTTRAENDLRPGGKFLFRMEAKDGSTGFDFTGIYTEVWKDVSYGIAPLCPEDAQRMVRETKCEKILQGVRGTRAYDMDFLIENLLRLSQLVMELEHIKEIDINPFKLFRSGGLALDVRIIL